MKKRIFLSYFFIYVVWGANFLSIYYAIQDIPPFTMVGSRFVIAGLILFIIDFARNRKLPNREESKVAILQGIFINLISASALAWAEQYVPTSFASIILASVPVWVMILDRENWKKNFGNRMNLIGLGLGILGVTMISRDGHSIPRDISSAEFTLGLIALFICTFSWSYGSIYVKKMRNKGSVIMNVAIQLLFAGIVQVLIGAFIGEMSGSQSIHLGMNSFLAMIHLIIFSSVIGYVAYIWLLRNRPAHEVSTHTFVNPVIAVFLGGFMIGEKISIQMLISLLMILLAVLFIRYHTFLLAQFRRFFSKRA